MVPSSVLAIEPYVLQLAVPISDPRPVEPSRHWRPNRDVTERAAARRRRRRHDQRRAIAISADRPSITRRLRRIAAKLPSRIPRAERRSGTQRRGAGGPTVGRWRPPLRLCHTALPRPPSDWSILAQSWHRAAPVRSFLPLSSTRGDTMGGVKPRVLVVDDDSALAEMLGIVLRTDGFEPAFVADGVARRAGLPGHQAGRRAARSDAARPVRHRRVPRHPRRERHADHHAHREDRHRRHRARPRVRRRRLRRQAVQAEGARRADAGPAAPPRGRRQRDADDRPARLAGRDRRARRTRSPATASRSR